MACAKMGTIGINQNPRAVAHSLSSANGSWYSTDLARVLHEKTVQAVRLAGSSRADTDLRVRSNILASHQCVAS